MTSPASRIGGSHRPMDRILVVSPENPFPPDSGGRLRTRNVVAILTRRYAVDVLTYERDDAGDAPDGVRIVPVPRTVTPRRAAVRSLYKLRNCGTYSHLDVDFGARLAALLAERDYAAAVIEHTMAGHLIGPIRAARPQMRIIVNAHNVEAALTRQIIASQKSVARRAYFRLNHVFTGWNERATLARADAVITCSAADTGRFRLAYPRTRATIVTVPNFLNAADYRHEPPAPREGAPRVILFGDMQYWPNVRAASFFHREVYPLLKARHPDLVWVIAGRNPHETIVSAVAGDPSVVVTGTVPDMSDTVRAADVVVVPLLEGSGTRFKLLEAWALGRPVVSTTIGAEGLECENGREVLIADTPAAFAEATSRVLSDPALATALARNAYETYRRLYHQEAVAERLLSVVDPERADAASGALVEEHAR